MEKRMFLAIALSILVVMVFSHFQTPPEDGSLLPDYTGDTQPIEQAEVDPAPTPEKTRQHSEPEITEKSDIESETIPYQTPHLEGYFERRGARLASVQLREFTRIDSDTLLYDLAGETQRGLTLETDHPGAGVSNYNYDLMKADDDNVFKFQTEISSGLKLQKTYDFDPEKPYQANLTVSLNNPTETDVTLDDIDFPIGAVGRASTALGWGPGFGIKRAEESRFDQIYLYYGKDGSSNYLTPGGGGGIGSLFGGNGETDFQYARGPADWTALTSRYFIAATVPDKPYNVLYIEEQANNDDFIVWSGYSAYKLTPGETREYNFRLYLGPKDYYALQDFEEGMESTLNYGWFTFLTLPLLAGMRGIYAVLPNYGFAIIILSLLIKLVLHPLTKKGLVSMQKMKKLQPKIKEIQEKYKDDKEKLNQKTMEFYQKNNLNPVGGCMPMLLQLPIFIALYRMLQYSIELRGEPFIFWITDLSARDPYYVLPVIMGILMFAQQMYTMSSGDGGAMGQQKTMAYIMPIVFVFIFMNFPVGLVLYWMTNSAATLGQYWLINRSMEE